MTATLLLAAALAAAPPIPNFHQVDERLYRGAQPQEGGLEALRDMGVKTIVNLRHEPELVAAEEAQARALGLTYVSIPMSRLARPKDEQIARILALLDDPAHGPVFVHCKAGRDRTGVAIACYRVARDAWTAEKAIEEALGYGMMKIEWAKRSYVRSYYRKLLAKSPEEERSGGAIPAEPGVNDRGSLPRASRN